jgi:hypothetical protein
MSILGQMDRQIHTADSVLTREAAQHLLQEMREEESETATRSINTVLECFKFEDVYS